MAVGVVEGQDLQTITLALALAAVPWEVRAIRHSILKLSLPYISAWLNWLVVVLKEGWAGEWTAVWEWAWWAWVEEWEWWEVVETWWVVGVAVWERQVETSMGAWMVPEEWAWRMAQWALEEVVAASLEVLLQCEGPPQEALAVFRLDRVVG
jgi:hypothetical protein